MLVCRILLRVSRSSCDTQQNMIFQSGPCVLISSLCFMVTPLSLPGLGYGSQVIILYTGVYYIIILAWAFLYLFSSFKAELPWTSCSNSWNTGINTFDKYLQMFFLKSMNTITLQQSLQYSQLLSILCLRILSKRQHNFPA